MDARTRKPASPKPGRALRDPERTRAAILAAATKEFSSKGLDGARVDEIARRAGVNKRMIYHYFGDKDGLYLTVLEASYAAIRAAERELRFEDLPPVEGMRALVRFTWEYVVAHPEFLNLLATENLHRAANLKKLPHIRDLHSPLTGMLSELLTRGVKQKVFRSGVDPVQLYISIAALGFFYLSNRYTLSTIFGHNLDTPRALAERGEHVVDMVLGYLRA